MWIDARGSENDQGSISVGKLADFTLLSEDITQCDPDAIKETNILKTIIEDETVYETWCRWFDPWIICTT